MAISGFDPTDPRAQLELANERLKYAEEKIRQLEETIKQAKLNWTSKERESNELRDERDDLKLKLGLANHDLKHIQENKASKERAFYATLILALASGSAGWGINLLTQTPSNLVGIVLLAFAIILYYIGGRLTTLLA